MRKNNVIILVFGIYLILILGCAATRSTYVGNWDYTVLNLPDGDARGLLVIRVEDGGYRCHVQSSDGMAEFDMENCTIEDNILTGHYYQDGNRIDITGTFSEEKLFGTVRVDTYEFPLELIRQKN
jgi:hypothetical protein